MSKIKKYTQLNNPEWLDNVMDYIENHELTYKLEFNNKFEYESYGLIYYELTWHVLELEPPNLDNVCEDDNYNSVEMGATEIEIFIMENISYMAIWNSCFNTDFKMSDRLSYPPHVICINSQSPIDIELEERQLRMMLSRL